MARARILKSRAIDDSGYQQPERSTLIAERGRNGYFHYNAIVSWAVAADGSLSHRLCLNRVEFVVLDCWDCWPAGA
jgi:hypothetical protein